MLAGELSDLAYIVQRRSPTHALPRVETLSGGLPACGDGKRLLLPIRIPLLAVDVRAVPVRRVERHVAQEDAVAIRPNGRRWMDRATVRRNRPTVMGPAGSSWINAPWRSTRLAVVLHHAMNFGMQLFRRCDVTARPLLFRKLRAASRRLSSCRRSNMATASGTGGIAHHG